MVKQLWPLALASQAQANNVSYALLQTISAGVVGRKECFFHLVRSKMPLSIVQIWIKIFIKSSLVRINTVCHLTLTGLILFSYSPILKVTRFKIMHQAFVTPATQRPGNSGDVDFFVCKARVYALDRGGNFLKNPRR